MENQQQKSPRKKVIKNKNVQIVESLDITARIPIASLDIPHYLMAQPLGFHASEANNKSMLELSDKERIVDRPRALMQWQTLYSLLASEAVVYLLPIPTQSLQDLIFASNAGAIIDDDKQDKFIVSNFKVSQRFGETPIIDQFFKLHGFNTQICPFLFEGQADLKKIGHKLYVGACGLRSEEKAFDWIMDNYDVKIIKVKPNNSTLYHLDCNFLPITKDDAICCLESFTKEEIRLLEKYIYLHPITTEQANFGAASVIRHYNQIIAGTFIYECETIDEEYKLERSKNRFLEDLCSDLGLDLALVNVSEIYKGGADLSCLPLLLNHASFNVDLI